MIDHTMYELDVTSIWVFWSNIGHQGNMFQNALMILVYCNVKSLFCYCLFIIYFNDELLNVLNCYVHINWSHVDVPFGTWYFCLCKRNVSLNYPCGIIDSEKLKHGSVYHTTAAEMKFWSTFELKKAAPYLTLKSSHVLFGAYRVYFREKWEQWPPLV